MTDRLIDPRLGAAKYQTSHGASSIIEDLSDAGLTFNPAPGLDIEDGLQALQSKMKQHLEGQIVIAHSSEESTGWKRYIAFNYEGNEYELTLFWEEFSGYDTYWREPDSAPNWVIEWDSEAHQGMSFEHYLDDLTWEMNK